MVLRKSSYHSDNLPYPTSPILSKAPAEPSINPQNHLDVDTSDLPPIPMSKQRQMDNTGDSPYHEYGNPWSQEAGSQQVISPTLQPGRSTVSPDGYVRPDLPQSIQIRRPSQVTPRSSLDSVRSRDFWDDDEGNNQPEDEDWDTHDPEEEAKEHTMLSTVPASGPTSSSPGNIKRKPVPAASAEQPFPEDNSLQATNDFASNNPFRRSASTERPRVEEPLSSSNAWSEAPRETRQASPKGKGREVLPNANYDAPSGLFVTNPNIEESSQLSVNSIHGSDFGNYHQGNDHEEDLLLPEPTSAPPPPPTTSPPHAPEVLSPFVSQPPLIPVSSEKGQDNNPWMVEPSHAPPPPPPPSDQHHQPRLSQYNDGLLDRGQESGVVSLGNELNSLPNAVEFDSPRSGSFSGAYGNDDDFAPPLPSRKNVKNSHGYQPQEKESFFTLDDNDFQAPEGPPSNKPPRPRPFGNSGPDEDYFNAPEGPPPTKPPRPAVVINTEHDGQLAKMIEQRNETYQIKHFNWFDHRTGSIRTSSMLTQNKNGPCPLLALVNALILGIKPDSQAALDNALRSREQVTLGLIIETLIDELMSSNYEDLPDVDELNRFLFILHTGMNANPRFVNIPAPSINLMDARNSVLHLPQQTTREQKPGEFEKTQDMKLYGAFSVPLVHGWLPSKRDPAWAAFTRSAQTYEDAQALQFGEEELEYKISHGGLVEAEERIWQDITAIKTFLKTYPTQLTPYGLDTIREWLLPGQFAIMFRNDHFSTIYKHPDGKLFTLITDAGYAERDEIVWESLTDNSGASEFFSGDFRPVGGASFESATPITDPSGPRQSSQYLSAPIVATPISPQERQEQHDADFAMALQLQEEEEQRANQNRQRANTNPSSTSRRNGEGNIPIRLRSREQTQEVRPSVPPRQTRAQTPAVNRPQADDGEDAPPAYEEAAKSRPYIPPLSSPHHPTADPSPRASTAQLGDTAPPPPANPRPVRLGQPAASSSRPLVQDGPRRLTNQRRMSAYGENMSRYPPGAYPGSASPSVGRAGGNAYGVGTGRQGQGQGQGQLQRGGGQDRDCVVM